MINEWRLGQFKSVEKMEVFALSPLTIFAGPNSSGKSSVLQSILLIAQTLASEVAQRHLVLNGKFLKLGTFDDVLSQGSIKGGLTIGFTLQMDRHRRESGRGLARGGRRYYPGFYYYPSGIEGQMNIDLTFGPPRLDEQEEGDAKFRSLQAQLLDARFVADLNLGGASSAGKGTNSLGPSQRLTLKQRSTQDFVSILATLEDTDREAKRVLNDRLLEYSAQLEPEATQWLRRSRAARVSRVAEGRAEIIAAQLVHFLPLWIIYTVSSALRTLTTKLEEMTEWQRDQCNRTLEEWNSTESQPVLQLLAQTITEIAEKSKKDRADLISELNRRCPSKLEITPEPSNLLHFEIISEVMKKLNNEDKAKRQIDFTELPEPLSILCSTVNDVFASLRYLGPLRDDPKPVYGIASSADPSDVGVKGEYTAAVLDLYANQEIPFLPPNDNTGDIIPCRLREAVLAWLRHFDMAESYNTREEGKLGHRLLIRPTGVQNDLDLTNVGVGVSQVLPIVVMALISEPGSVLLFEQPELHLHPRVQSLLADFFLSVTKTGRQCLIETHSEYLINRLRLRVAEAPWENPLQERIMLYFVERSGSAASFRQVTINEYGAIPDWPTGFFDQGPTESDRILRASVEKRKRRRPSNS